MTRRLLAAVALALAVAPTTRARAQDAPARADTLRLGALHRAAEAADPRGRQLDLLVRQTDLRLSSLGTGWLPSLRLDAEARYQSDVFDAAALPVGAGFPAVPRSTYDASVSVEQALVDLTIGPRRGVERARLAESEAGVHAALYDLRREANDVFFTTALLAERRRLVAATVTELEGRRREAAARVLAGAALPGDTAALDATLLERQQALAEIDASRHAAAARLAALTGWAVADTTPVRLPDLADAVGTVRAAVPSLRLHPEYARLARTGDRLAREETALGSEQLPRVAAFGRFGYGRPGLNPIGDRFDTYYVVGVELRWAPWTWGRVGHEREALAVQRDIVTTEESALAARLTRAVEGDFADVDRLTSALALDDRIVALRDQVEAETRARFSEGVVTAADFLDRSTDALEARLTRATHRVELARARAHLLTTLGVEIP